MVGVSLKGSREILNKVKEEHMTGVREEWGERIKYGSSEG